MSIGSRGLKKRHDEPKQMEPGRRGREDPLSVGSVVKEKYGLFHPIFQNETEARKAKGEQEYPSSEM